MKMYLYHCQNYNYCKSAVLVTWWVHIFYTRFSDKNGVWLVNSKIIGCGKENKCQVLGTSRIIYWRETAFAISELKTQVKNMQNFVL